MYVATVESGGKGVWGIMLQVAGLYPRIFHDIFSNCGSSVSVVSVCWKIVFATKSNITQAYLEESRKNELCEAQFPTLSSSLVSY